MNIVATRAAEGFPRRSFTVAEIRRMVEAGIIAEDENFELIDGEVVPMSPKGNQHEVIKAALTEVLAARKPHDLRLGVETSLYLDERTFVEPDLCLLSEANPSRGCTWQRRIACRRGGGVLDVL